MFQRKFLAVLGLLAALPASAAERAVLDFQGYSWETGGFPPSSAGDMLNIPCIVNDLSDVLGFDLQSSEVTGWITGLISQGSMDLGGGVTVTHFGTGSVRFFSDPGQDHVFAAAPENSQVPASFANGELCLGGALEDFVLFFNTLTGSGAFEPAWFSLRAPASSRCRPCAPKASRSGECSGARRWTCPRVTTCKSTA